MRTSSDAALPGLVSVITIFHDEEAYLAEAVESVLAQTYGEWELLLCDDGSADASPSIARAFAAAHPQRIRVLTHAGGENRGMSATRNLGLREARGEFVAFLDGDDVWLPEKLERQVAALRAVPDAALAYGPTLFWRSWAGGEDSVRETGVAPGRVREGAWLLRQMLEGRATTPATCSALMRRDAVLAVGGFEDAFRGMYEDQAFFAKLLPGVRALPLDACLDRYRQHAESTVARAERSGDYSAERPSPARDRFLAWLAGRLAGRPGSARLRWIVARERWLYRHPRAAWLRTNALNGARNARGLAVMAAYAVGRRVLPAGVRTALWRRREGTP